MAGRLVPRQRRTILGVVVLAAALAPLLTGPAGAVTVCNTTPIVFTPPTNPTPAVQTLQPYPSTINISGQTGTVSDVNVTLNDFTYQFPEDVDVLLVAPDGTTFVLMSDIGGNNDTVAEPVNEVDLTFDDEAATPVPADSQVVSGTFRPVDDDNDPGEFVEGNVDQFPTPAPAPGAGTTLSVFDGLAPNGTWSLYVVDDEPGPAIVQDIGGGWCLDITTSGTGTTTPTTVTPTTVTPTTVTPTTVTPTTVTPTTVTPTTVTPTTVTPTTVTPTTVTPTTVTPTTVTPTTVTPTTVTPTTVTPTTVTPTTVTPTTTAPGTCDGRTPTIVGTAGNDQIFGTAGPDVIVGGGGNDSIQGLGGDDVICGGAGNDSILGGEGNDRVFGEAGSDQVYGGNGNDFVSGGAGGDRVWGEAGNDALDGGADPDQCVGGTGTDTAAACESVVEVP